MPLRPQLLYVGCHLCQSSGASKSSRKSQRLSRSSSPIGWTQKHEKNLNYHLGGPLVHWSNCWTSPLSAVTFRSWHSFCSSCRCRGEKVEACYRQLRYVDSCSLQYVAVNVHTSIVVCCIHLWIHQICLLLQNGNTIHLRWHALS